MVRMSQNGRRRKDSGQGSSAVGWFGTGDLGEEGSWLLESEVSNRYTPPEFMLSAIIGPKDGRLALCVVKGVSLLRCLVAKVINVELIGVGIVGPFSTVGEAKRTMCSRRLEEDLLVLIGGL